MKSTGFKNKYSPLKKTSGFKRVSKRMKKFREVKGELPVLQVAEADAKFSREIRKRDGQCMRCGATWPLSCSHYFNRGKYGTRFDPFNCTTLCTPCHDLWENDKEGEYKSYMIMWLGEVSFFKLKERSKIKVSPYDAIQAYMKLSKSIEDNEIQY